MECFDEQTVLRFLGGELSVARLGDIEQHLDGCPACFALVVAAASASRRTPAPALAERTEELAALDLPADQLLAGRYRLRRALGAGASGRVFEAFDELAQVPVALKVLRPDLAADPRWIKRLTRELQVARRIDHPNVGRVLNMESDQGHPFLVMELAVGSLRAELHAGGPDTRSRPAALADARAIASGLEAIHAAGIVHRDVKPENVLRMADGRLVVSDFGLAALSTGPETLTLYVGTPSYMAPELTQGEPATVASDIWSLGVVLHELLFGARPRWKAGSRRRILEASATGLGHGERALARLCADCLSTVPEERPHSVAELVRRLLAAEARTAGPLGGWRRLVVSLAILSTSAGAGVLLLWATTRAPASAPEPAPPVRPKVLIKRDFSRSMPPGAAAIVEKVIGAAVTQIPGLDVGEWRRPPVRRRADSPTWTVVLGNGQQDDREIAQSEPGAVPVKATVVGADGTEAALSSEQCPAGDLARCVQEKVASFIQNALRTSIVPHLVRERARREAGNAQARAALELYFNLSPAERAAGGSSAERYLDLALQADPRGFAPRLESVARKVNRMVRELREDEREAIHLEIEDLQETRPAEHGVPTLRCRALTAFALVRTPTDDMLRAAEAACQEALRSEIDDSPVRFALARLRAQWCDAEGVAVQLQRIINRRSSFHGPVGIRTRTTRAGGLASLLLVDSLVPDESPSHWAMTVATINGGGELERGQRTGAEQTFRSALLESHTQEVWRGGGHSAVDSARTAAVLTGLLQTGPLPIGEVNESQRQVAAFERIMSLGGLVPADLLPYLWVDPRLALNKLKRLTTGTNCGALIKSAVMYHALGDRRARDGALGACPRDDQWIAACRTRLSEAPGAASPLVLTSHPPP